MPTHHPSQRRVDDKALGAGLGTAGHLFWRNRRSIRHVPVNSVGVSSKHWPNLNGFTIRKGYVMARMNGLALGLGSIAAVVTGFLALHYVKSGVRGRNAALMPDSLEQHIDDAIEWLDVQLGQNWVDQGLVAVRTSLSHILPLPAVALADVIYAAERIGRRKKWNGLQKRQYAAQLCKV